MAQAIYCPVCQVFFTAELRGKSCPACGEELIHARFPASKKPMKKVRPNAYRAVWDHMLKRDPCSICGIERSTTIDHIQPKALGGSKGSWTNRTGMCRPCNAQKAHTPLLFFMLERQGIDIAFLKDEEGNWPLPDDRPEEEAEEGPTGKEAVRFNIHEIINERYKAQNTARPHNEKQLAEDADRWLSKQLDKVA